MTLSANSIGGAVNLLNLNLRFRDALEPLAGSGIPTRQERNTATKELIRLQKVIKECSADDALTTVIIPNPDPVWEPWRVRTARLLVYRLAEMMIRWAVKSDESHLDHRIPPRTRRS